MRCLIRRRSFSRYIPISRFSSTVICENTLRNWGTMAMPAASTS